MIVTKAPSEPWSIVKQTLKAMLAQDYAHDTWLADEDPSAVTKRWCKKNGVKISSRKGIADYHQATWPRRTKCKEGNLAYFYDKYGYKNYDFVSQLDADHVPTPGYLREVLKPFLNPKIGYVSAPSICDANATNSWAARGRLYAEATLHGPLQAGYNGGWANLCIGSHYAVRTKALKQIGGLGPELAEDHSTTLLMHGHGWKGVHAIDAIAHGDGPATFADCMTQEYQWSRSLTVILLTMFPRLAPKLPKNIAFQFLFSQIWYPLFGFTMFFAYTLPIVALITGVPWVDIVYLHFLVLSSLSALSSLVLIRFLKAKELLRPVNAKVVSWEMVLFQITRWPWIVLGVLSGAAGVILRKNFSFKITPKGNFEAPPLPFQTIIPYILVVTVYSTTALLVASPSQTSGYYYFVLTTVVSYLVALFVILRKHIQESKVFGE